MPEPGSEANSFETRLRALDRRLRELQEEPPSGDPAPVEAAVSPVGGPAAEAGPEPTPPAPPQLAVVLELYARLIAAVRELLSGYELVGAQLSGTGASGKVALSAGPFDGTAALREFERALAALPGVQSVALRGYEADDRAIVDVQLG
jgi:hypothetical protein